MTDALFGPQKGDASMPEPNSQQAATGTPAPSSAERKRGSAATQQLRFEDAYGRLEEIVAEMERGDLPLEQLIERFEEGVGLVRSCNEFLKQAQLRVEQYVELKDGQWMLKALE
jgi:exodeoxyribonuclease VII small subunit